MSLGEMSQPSGRSTIRRHAVPFDGLTTQPPLWVHAHFQQRGARAAVQGPVAHQPGLVWFCGPGVVRVVGCYWLCCAHWRAYWLGESQPTALWGCSSL